MTERALVFGEQRGKQIRELGVRAVLPDESLDVVPLAPLAWFADDAQDRATEVGHEDCPCE
jgi:hypothetical protein